MKIKPLLPILASLILYSCSSSRIEVRDNSSMVDSKSVLFAKLDSIYNYRLSNIANYSSSKAKIDISYSGSNYKLNGKVNIVTNKSFKANVSLPFPPLSVGSVQLENNLLTASSSYVDLNINKQVPSYILPVFNSLIYGAMPLDVLKSYSLTSIYIKDSRYHLVYVGPYSSTITFQIDQQYRICQLSISSPEISSEMYTTDFKCVDTHILPSNIRIILSSSTINGSVNITTNTIKLNQ